MKEVTKQLKQSIDLDGYSSSPGWFGFFESTGQYDSNLIDDALNLFGGYFYDYLSNSKIVFSFSIYESIQKTKKAYSLSKEQENLLSWLHKQNWLKISPAEAEFISVNSCDYSREDIIMLISAILRLGDFIGHCFVMFPQLHLIIYPHEDIGFGVVSTGIDGKEKADKFLRKVARNKKFAAFKGKGCDENQYTI